MTTPHFLKRPSKPDIAWHAHKPKNLSDKPGLVWLGGYASDMDGTKAQYLEQVAQKLDCAFVRFDYTGHGQSGGVFEDGCISDWAADAQAVLDTLCQGPQILIGSSMGGWIACLLARQNPARLAGLIMIAPAPDFTHALMWPSWDEATQHKLLREGQVSFPSEYDDSTMVYTKKLYEDGKKNLIFSQPLTINAPVRILQGMQDDSVPWQHAAKLADHLTVDDLVMTLTKAGDHRLSSPQDLKTLARTVTEVSNLCAQTS